jgi:diguanylate cyclase (GGDEF)-like protein/PAS domain S-box-containing protein
LIDGLWNGLLANFALVALVVSLWTYSQDWLESWAGPVRALAFGLLLGAGAVALMFFPVPFRPGIFLDLRTTPIVISGFFGGPVAGVAALVVAATCRLLMGGSGAWPGVASLGVAASIGIAGYLLRGKRPMRSPDLVRLAIAAAPTATVGMLFLPADIRLEAFSHLAVPLAVLVFASTLVVGLALYHENRRREVLRENLAYRTLTEALPDCLVAKDLSGRFITVNSATARLYRQPDKAAMIGKTDFDFFPRATAEGYRADEEAMLASGAPTALLQRVDDSDGTTKWMSSLKVPMRDENGAVVGILTHARDITQQRQLEADALESQKHLKYALEQMSDGLAMFDRGGRLIFCNEQYRAFFPLTGSMRQPGVHIRAMLKAAVDSGEQLGMPQDQPDQWIEQVAASLFVAGEEEAHLFDSRWLHIRTRPTEDGSSMVVVSDVTKIKHAETALVDMTDRLKLLATTDGLTGLLNRRAFDQSLDNEVARSIRSQTPLSLLIIDIDRFKAFNDLYGHPAGDECLRVVSRCLSETVKRPSDIVARYGGEEFVAILPDTDEDGAFVIADAFREALKAHKLEHANSEKGIVTASVGIATFAANARGRRASELVTRADEALYGAKEAGRDRVNGWRKRYDAQQAG